MASSKATAILSSPPPNSGETARHSIGLMRSAWGSLSRNLPGSFTLDLRSLAVFRIGLGLAILADAFLAMGNAQMFLSDSGMMPRELLYERHWPAVTSWSLHALGGSVEYIGMLLVAQMLAAIWMIVGWRTRIATLACWVLVSSLETRNPTITNGADAMTRLLLFWGLFLPLGARWSLDAAGKRGDGRMHGDSVTSIASAALLLQVAFVYWFSVVCKTHHCWWGDGSALGQALQLDLFARPLGVWLRGHPELCRALTYGWLVVEIVGPLLAFVPVWRAGFRIAAVLLFFGFHAGIELTMDIGAFPFVMAVAWTSFLPGVVWERLRRKFQNPIFKLQGVFKFQVPNRFTQSARAFDTNPEPSQFPEIWSWRVERFRIAVCLAALAFVFMWNLRGTNFTFWERIFPRSVNPVAFALRLDQHWSMFAPRPLSDDGWFVLRAGMSDGAEVDLLRDGAPVDFRKPALVSATFKDARWQKIITNVWMEEYQHLRGPLGDAMARQWNATHGGLSQVVAWQLWFMLEPTLPDGSAGPVKPLMLFDRERFGGAPLPWGPPARLSASDH